MRLVCLLSTVATVAALAAPVLATPTQLTDVQYIEANRCLGLMSTKAIGTPDDAAAMKAFLKTQTIGRESFVYDQAEQARDDGQMDANRSGAEHQARLLAERDGVCRSLIGGSSNTSTAAVGGANHTLQ
jgi:hypothetical protein